MGMNHVVPGPLCIQEEQRDWVDIPVGSGQEELWLSPETWARGKHRGVASICLFHLLIMMLLLPPFQFGCLLLLSVCLTAVSKMSSSMLNSLRGEIFVLSLLSLIFNKTFSLFLFNLMLTEWLFSMAYIMSIYVPSIAPLMIFFHNGCFIISHVFPTFFI